MASILTSLRSRAKLQRQAYSWCTYESVSLSKDKETFKEFETNYFELVGWDEIVEKFEKKEAYNLIF